VSATNYSNVDNSVHVNANTGNNQANQNTVGGSISTGDVTGNLSIQNQGGSGLPDLSGLSGGSFEFNSSNSLTGADSNNSNQISLSKSNALNVHNSSKVDNDVSFWANTGGNKADKNTQGGSITTGSIFFGLNIANLQTPVGRGGGSNPPPAGQGGGNSPLALATGLGSGAATALNGLAATGANTLLLSLVIALALTYALTQAKRLHHEHVVLRE
jgi:hypothetical protein